MEPVLALDVRARLGESPVWSADETALYFVDIKGRAIHRFAPATGAHAVFEVGEDIGSIGLVRGGGFIAGMRSGLWRLDAAGKPLQLLAANPEDQAHSRFNDGIVDPAGRFVVGTIDETRERSGASLYRYDRRGLVRLVPGLLTSNGLAFSPDGRTMYHADTRRYVVNAYDYDPATGGISGERRFLAFTPTPGNSGRPDGAAVDSAGCYWIALYEGGRIERYSPGGERLARYQVPARCPTMVAFGGPDLRTLYITTASDGRPADELAALPHSGSLFALPVDVPGLARPSFDPNA